MFGEILYSTIWQEADHTRLVWITMLALKDERHQVMASVPGLAKAANVTREQCEEALRKFLSPDPDSRSQDFEGRRIEKVDGGWWILNGEKFQRRQSLEEKKEHNAEYMRKYRKSKQNNEFVNNNVMDVRKSNECNESGLPDQNRPEQTRTKQNTIKNNTPTSNDPDVIEVFDAFRNSWGRTNQYQLTPQRKKWVKNAITSYDKATCLDAVLRFRNDNFDRRAEFNDIKYLFGTQDRIDKWCGAQVGGSTVMVKAQKKHQESQDRMSIVNNFIDAKENNDR